MSHEQSATAAATSRRCGRVAWLGEDMILRVVASSGGRGGHGMAGQAWLARAGRQGGAHFSSGRRSALQPDFEFFRSSARQERGQGVVV